MKQLQLVLFFLTVTSLTFAQDTSFDLKSTELYKDKVRERNYGFESIGKTDKHFYYMHLPFKYAFGYNSVGSNEVPNIIMLDNDLNLIKKQALDLETENKERDYQGAVFFEDKTYILSSFQNTDHKKHYLFVHSMKNSTLETNNDLKKIGEIDYSGINKYFRTYFHLELSEDKSKVLIYYNIINKKNVNLKYGMYVFDNSFKLLWKHENVVPLMLNEGRFLYKQFKVDNIGNVYIRGLYHDGKTEENLYLPFSGKIRGDKLTYFSKYPFLKQMIIYFSNSGKKQKEVIINIPNKSIQNMTFIPVGNDNILCAGSYSEKKLISAKGLFSFKYNIKTKQYRKIYSKELKRKLEDTGLEEKFFEKFQKKANNPSEWDPFGYVCSDFIKNDKGEYICVAEQFLEGVRVQRSGNVINQYPLYIQNDLFQFTVTASGLIKKINQIKKRQYYKTIDIFSSYYAGLSGNKHFFLFAEMIRNETFSKISEYGNLYLVEVDEQGNQKKHVISKPDDYDKKMYFHPSSGIILSDKEIVFAVSTAVFFKYYAFRKLLIK